MERPLQLEFGVRPAECVDGNEYFWGRKIVRNHEGALVVRQDQLCRRNRLLHVLHRGRSSASGSDFPWLMNGSDNLPGVFDAATNRTAITSRTQTFCP